MHGKPIVYAVLLAVLCVLSVSAEQAATQRDAALRKGPAAYFDKAAEVRAGTSLEVGETRDKWRAAQFETAQGWMPLLAFEAPRAGIDYSGMLTKKDAVVISSVDIAAATKGAFVATYSAKYNVDFEVANQLDHIWVDPTLAARLAADLSGHSAERVLARLPHRPFENTVILCPEAELLLGRALAAHVFSGPLVDDAALSAYVNAVAAVVGAKTERYDLTYRVAIMDDPAIGGFGLPGGYVLLTRGLVDIIADEAELACVVGHEMAHASLYHGLREFSKHSLHRKRDAAFAELAELTGDTTPSDVEQDLNELADISHTKIIGERARADELEADLYGIAYAAAAGYDPRAMVGLLERIGRTDMAADPFKHHPAMSVRIEQLQKQIPDCRLQWGGQKRMAERFVRMARTPPATTPPTATPPLPAPPAK